MVKWSIRARADLKAIHDYISEDSPINAKAVVLAIRERAQSVANFPYLGRVVPEVNDKNLRELSMHSWRIFYHLRDGDIYIVTLIHKRRQLSPEEIKPLN